MKKLLCTLLCLVAVLTLFSCNSTPKVKGTVYAQITMMDGGVITLQLDGDTAPITVGNFVKLANEEFYDGIIFHRVIEGFVIQGGDPTGNGTGGSAQKIKGEFALNRVTNNISHKRGVISMARGNDKNSASSQFFICHGDCSADLDGRYAAFGWVIAGMDVVDKIASVDTNYYDKPLAVQRMKSVRIVDKDTAMAAVAAEASAK